MPLRKGWLAGACVGVTLIAAGCSSLSNSLQIESKKVDYKSAGKLPPLEVPPDLTRPGGDERFVVPDINPKGTATYSQYESERTGRGAEQRTALSSSVLPVQEGVKVEREGNQRWLVVTGRPDQVWPVVKEFWLESGFLINIDMPEAGVMETDWAENRAKIQDQGIIRNFLGKVLDQLYSTSERDKFRTRLERGTATDTTEIYISHRGMEEVYVGTEHRDANSTRWQPRPPDPELEAEMLRRLMSRFGVQDARARQQIATAQQIALPRATLSRAGSGPATLTINEQFDRAWRRVGLALDRVGFTVEDRDRSKGVYFVRYIDPQIDNQTAKSDQGFLSRLKFWGNDPKAKTEQFRIQVRDVDQGAVVDVLNKEGTQESSDTARKILALLYDQLK